MVGVKVSHDDILCFFPLRELLVELIRYTRALSIIYIMHEEIALVPIYMGLLEL